MCGGKRIGLVDPSPRDFVLEVDETCAEAAVSLEETAGTVEKF